MNSIKIKLILLIVGALFLVSVTFGIVSYTQARKTLLQETERNFLQITTEISRVIQANMEKNIAIVETLGQRRVVDDNTPWAEKVAYMKSEAERTGFQKFALADLSGKAVIYNQERTTVNISDRPYFKRALSGEPTFSDIVMSREEE
jgi:methyl-accepting chemotaxis protein